MSDSNAFRKRFTVIEQVPQDGRKYTRRGDPVYLFDVIVEVDVDRIARRVARQAARNWTGRSTMHRGAATARVTGTPRPADAEGREVAHG